MDMYGIGDDLNEIINLYFREARGTGRTTAMLKHMEQLRCPIVLAANRSMRLPSPARIMTVEPYPEKIYHALRGIRGEVVMDHSLVEVIYNQALYNTYSQLNYLYRELRTPAPINSRITVAEARSSTPDVFRLPQWERWWDN